MKMIFNAYCKKLFGIKYEKVAKSLFLGLILFSGLYTAGFKVPIAAPVLYLMISAFTGGTMWLVLSSEGHGIDMQHMLMLPFDSQKFVLSYTAALGAYTFFTKTSILLAALLAVSVWTPFQAFGCILCIINAVLTAGAIYSLKKYWYFCIPWAAAVIIFILFCKPFDLLLLIANCIFAAILLQNTDAYTFYAQKNEHCYSIKSHKHYSVLIYLFRYLKFHKNYLMNTLIMWCIACFLPLFFRQMNTMAVISIGFAILSLNTPICILLSCDPALEQSLRFLPGQKKFFCIPYCFFIFLCNMAADSIFLCSWQMQNHNITIPIIGVAVFFALQSAFFSVLLEWFYPIRSWKTECDLWHHPRKYIVPGIMLLVAGIIGAM